MMEEMHEKIVNGNSSLIESGSNASYAEIVIPLALPKNYTWKIPEHLKGKIIPGCRVEVNLGKNKKYAGLVKKLIQQKPDLFDPKDILNLLDEEPVLYEQQLKLWEWMAAYYMCSEGEVMAAALPAHFKLSSESIVVFNEEYGEDFSMLDHDEYMVAEALQIKNELKLTEIQQILDSSNIYPVINRLINKRVCFVWETLQKGYKPKKETYVLLEPEFENEDKLSDLLNNWSRAPKQMELLLSYLHLQKTEGEVIKSSLLKKSDASDAQLKGLVEKNILRIEKRNIDRILALPKAVQIDFTLSTLQENVLTSIKEIFTEKPVCLLHGVTASGKTQVYVKLIEEFISKGKQVLFMLPEIALTSQIIRRLQKHFGGNIGVYHSKFNQNERVEIWNKIKHGEMKIVLGARSSLFMPFNNLGLIICDEEYDSSFKQQDPAPRYNARDAAIYYAAIFDAKVLLGSATPSLETYHNTVTGKYGLVEMDKRFHDVQLPGIKIIDTKKNANKSGAKIMLTQELIDAINETLAKKRQVILFQNRRGYTPYQVCKVCAWIPQCKHCAVSLTFHKLSNKLLCHYCGTTYPPLQTCAACGNHQFIQKNFGTEKIEEQLREEFPHAKIARMDMDTVRGKNAHDTLIQQFEQGRIDILVGTQMVVKGLDFERVDLVGVLDADGLLHFADFRVNERAFQLMEQVSGRAGRKDNTSKVLIQSAQVGHPLLKLVQEHNYKKMYEREIDQRKQFFYPPFSRIIHILFRHRVKDVVEDAAKQFADGLRTRYGKYIVGPAEPVINRVRNQYRMEMLFKLPRDMRFIENCKADIDMQTLLIHQQKRFRSVIIVPDVDSIF